MKTKQVVTSFHTDKHKLTWLNDIKDYVPVIYQKNDQLKTDEHFIQDGYIHIPNHGRCDYAFLWHIIHNYNNLADITIFTKVNWKDNGINFSNLINNAEKYDYSEAGEYAEYHVWIDKSVTLKSIPHKGKHTSINDVSNPEKDNSHIFEADQTVDYYKHIFKNTPLPMSQLIWGHGPCFAVSSRLIHNHPVEIYEWLLNRFHIESNSWNNKKAKEVWKDKYSEDILQKEILSAIGHHYHNTLLRFWRILFTHNIDHSTYKIQLN